MSRFQRRFTRGGQWCGEMSLARLQKALRCPNHICFLSPWWCRTGCSWWNGNRSAAIINNASDALAFSIHTCNSESCIKALPFLRISSLWSIILSGEHGEQSVNIAVIDSLAIVQQTQTCPPMRHQGFERPEKFQGWLTQQTFARHFRLQRLAKLANGKMSITYCKTNVVARRYRTSFWFNQTSS